MSLVFTPRLDILPSPQRELWEELGQVPADFTLYGGTAIAVRLGHRQSVDFDFFAMRDIDPDVLTASLPFLRDAIVLQKAPNTLTMLVERGGPVQTSFFGVPSLGSVLEPDRADDNQLRVASLLDLAGSKLFVVQKRAESRDYIDIDAIIAGGQFSLSDALAAAQLIFGRQFNPQVSLKALSYFGDGTLPQLAPTVRNRLAAAARSVDLDRLPQFTAYRAREDGGI